MKHRKYKFFSFMIKSQNRVQKNPKRPKNLRQNQMSEQKENQKTKVIVPQFFPKNYQNVATKKPVQVQTREDPLMYIASNSGVSVIALRSKTTNTMITMITLHYTVSIILNLESFTFSCLRFSTNHLQSGHVNSSFHKIQQLVSTTSNWK